MKSEYQDNRKRLAEMIKTEPTKTPIQQVTPVIVKEEKTESHVNFWIPSDLMEQLKLRAVKSKKSIKQIGIEAFESYLSKNI